MVYNRVGRRNAAREQKLTAAQADRYRQSVNYWLERGSYYTQTTNYPDDLCWVLACRDLLDLVTGKFEAQAE